MSVIIYSHLFILASLIFAINPTPSFHHQMHYKAPGTDWCDTPPRPGLEKLKEVKISNSWFKVYDVGNATYAIEEPYNWEETISYLILGKEKALLFDTGMGLDSISNIVRLLTKLPVVVLNSHTHPDHIGSNTEFGDILAMNTAYTRSNAMNGYPHSQVAWEVSPSAFCLAHLHHHDTAHYFVRPFTISRFITDGYVIDLGKRKIQVVATPGHAPDAICLFDKQAHYLWCGDSFYEGPILLTDRETNLEAYRQSINKIASLAQLSTSILPAHNLPISQPATVIKAAMVFNNIASRAVKGKQKDSKTLVFDSGKFSYEIGTRFVSQLLSNKAGK